MSDLKLMAPVRHSPQMKRALLMSFFYIVVLTQSAIADHIADPCSYSVASKDGRYIFVMLASVRLESDGIGVGKAEREEAQRLRKKYHVSGLYLNDESTTLLWTVDWYAYAIILPSDGVHLVRQGPWASQRHDEALSFCANGKVIKSYRVADLVDFTWLLPHSVSHFRWSNEMALDDEGQALALSTLDRSTYVFDTKTGKILSSSRPTRLALVGVLAATVFLAFVIPSRKRKRRLRRSCRKEG